MLAYCLALWKHWKISAYVGPYLENKRRHLFSSKNSIFTVAVHLGVKMEDTLSFTAKVDMVNFWV